MKHQFLLPGQIVYHQDVVKHGMISIAVGILEVLSNEDRQSPIIAFKSGTVLGEAALFLSLPSRATVRAVTYTELQVCFSRLFESYFGVRSNAPLSEGFAAIKGPRQQTVVILTNIVCYFPSSTSCDKENTALRRDFCYL